MTAYEYEKDRVMSAANALAQAIAREKSYQKEEIIIEKKGKTLYHVNRETIKRAKMTVND